MRSLAQGPCLDLSGTLSNNPEENGETLNIAQTSQRILDRIDEKYKFFGAHDNVRSALDSIGA
jgi:hypothetical protein